MYIGRTHLPKNRVIAVGLIALASILTGTVAHSTFAQGTNRLSSDPHDLRDAFARHSNRVNTPQAFANFVSQNNTLSQRYAQHFGVPQDRLVSFLRTSLVSYTLPSAQTLTTYGVNNSGTIYPVSTTLPKGTRVWATREGTPVLKWNCSNPLIATLPGSNLTPPLEYASTPAAILPAGSTPIAAVPELFASVGSPSLPESGDLLAIAPSIPAPTFAFGVPGTSDTSSDALPGVGEIIEAAAPRVKDFWPALLVPAIFAVTQGGDSTGSGVIVDGGSTGGSCETPPLLAEVTVVPESNTLGLIAVGLPMIGIGGFIARRRK